MSEAICTCHCGGSMFYRHLHAESCVLSREGEEAPKSELETLRDERDRLARAIVWALGYTDFRAREQGEGAYWWRTELRLRAKLTGEQIDAIQAALTPAGGGKDE